MLPEIQDQAAFNKVSYQIHASIPRMEGWASVEKCKDFARIIMATQPAHACEIGVYGGRGLLAVALAMRSLGKGVCMGIDPWAPGESVKGMDQTNTEWWGKLDHEKIYQGCIEAIADWGAQKNVAICRMPSDDVYIAAMPKLGLLIVDGNHGEQSIRDVQRFAPLVTPGGWVYMDDLDWSGGAVREAEKQLISLGFEFRMRRDEGAFYQRGV